jgi:PAS domain S-box-containing protein
MAQPSRSFDDELVGLFELSHDAFCIAGFDGYLKRANAAFPRLLGYTLGELLALPFVENIYPEDRESVEAALAELAAGNPVVGFECRHVRADGSVRWFEWSTSGRTEAGVMYGVARDVTDRRIASDELSALRRVATLAAEGVAPADLFAVVAEEVARVVDVPIVTVVRYELDATLTVCATFPTDNSPFRAGNRLSLDGTTLSALVRDRSAAVRIDDYSQLDGEIAAAVRGAGIRSTVGVPIVVAGRLWGAMAGWTRAPEPLPEDTAGRLARFTELLATAIANAESREALGRLADEQAALRRVATLVARGAAPAEVFAAVADELARYLDVVNAGLLRFEADGTGYVVAVQYEPGITQMPVTGEHIPLAGDDVGALVLRTGRAARVDNHDNATGPEAARIRAAGIGSIVGVPIVVDGRLWGAAIVGSRRPEPMPTDTEARLADFADLVATAIANAATRAELQAGRDELRALAEQQAALRRVATLVARGTPPSEVFSTVAEELAGCLHAGNASVNRFEGDEVAVLALSHLEPGMQNKPVVGERHTLEGDNIATRVLHTGRAARLDSSELCNAPGSIAARLWEMGLRSTVAVPIVVDERVWGMAALGSTQPEPLPEDTEARMGDFADLIATSIASAATRAELQASRDELSVLAEQQAALRRVATLVARGVDPSEVFSAVVIEMAHRLHAGHAAVYRYADDSLVPLAVSHEDGLQPLPKGLRLRLEGDNVAARVLATGGATRMDRHDDAPVPHAGRMRGLGIHSAVGVPIIVDGRAWGAAIVGSLRPEPLPPDTESRMRDFTDLVSTAIANAATRSDLIASRARIVAAADEGRRRLERDLHDGAQQRLIALGLQTRLAEGSVPPGMRALKEQLGDIASALAGVSADLQEISRGIHPAILSRGGLGPALKTLARRSAVPVTLDLAIDRRLPDSVEVGAYYVVSEALTNAAKHSRASEVDVCGRTKDHMLCLSIRDNGIGGADLGNGSGLLGLRDRVEALGGRMRIMSPAGSGTSLEVTIPFGGM